MATKISTKHVETLTHDEAKRKIIPSVEQQSIAVKVINHLGDEVMKVFRVTA
jgi:hypothetical protein